MSEFDTLRSDLSAIRGDMEARFAALAGRYRIALRDLTGGYIDSRFAKLEAKLDEKPSVTVIYQAAFGTFVGMFAVIVGAVVILKTTVIIP